MPDSRNSRFPAEKAAYEKRERLSCFARFYGESVWDAQGMVIHTVSTNKCQDCPDGDICFRLTLLNQLNRLTETQQDILTRLYNIESFLTKT